MKIFKNKVNPWAKPKIILSFLLSLKKNLWTSNIYIPKEKIAIINLEVTNTYIWNVFWNFNALKKFINLSQLAFVDAVILAYVKFIPNINIIWTIFIGFGPINSPKLFGPNNNKELIRTHCLNSLFHLPVIWRKFQLHWSGLSLFKW